MMNSNNVAVKFLGKLVVAFVGELMKGNWIIFWRGKSLFNLKIIAHDEFTRAVNKLLSIAVGVSDIEEL